MSLFLYIYVYIIWLYCSAMGVLIDKNKEFEFVIIELCERVWSFWEETNPVHVLIVYVFCICIVL